MIHDCEVYFQVPIILERPFLITGQPLVDRDQADKFRLNNEQVNLILGQYMKQPKDMHVISMVDTIQEYELVVPIKIRLSVEALAVLIMNFDSNGINEYDATVSILIGKGSYTYAPQKMDLDLKNRVTTD